MSEEKAEYKIEDRPPTIFRTVKNKDNPYVMIDQRPILNKELSWKAKGILCYLMSRPDGWECNLVDLSKRSNDGLSSVKAGVKELQEAGHIKMNRTRTENGQLGTVLWEVYETPQVDNQLVVKPHMGVSPQVEKPQVDKPQVDNLTQVVLSTLSSNELSSAPKPIKKDMMDGILFYAGQAVEQGIDQVENTLVGLERGLKRNIPRHGVWQDLAKWMNKRPNEPYQKWVSWYMKDNFNAKNAWRLTPEQIRNSWPGAFVEEIISSRIHAL
jgi:hypothetical protein